MKQKMFLDAAETIIKENNFKIEEKNKKNILIKHFKIDSDNYNVLKKDKGDYYTISYNKMILLKNPKRLTKEIENVLNMILRPYKKNGTTLIVGVGNSSIIADSLGPKTTNKIIATNHYDDFLTIPKLALFVPEVIGKTGISSYNLIKMLVTSLKPDTIIIIDSLATTDVNKLNYSIEISDTGIIPGSALGTNKKINKKTFGIPVIAIGAPLMIDFDKNLYTTPDISDVISKTSNIIASSINTIYLK